MLVNLVSLVLRLRLVHRHRGDGSAVWMGVGSIGHRRDLPLPVGVVVVGLSRNLQNDVVLGGHTKALQDVRLDPRDPLGFRADLALEDVREAQGGDGEDVVALVDRVVFAEKDDADRQADDILYMAVMFEVVQTCSGVIPLVVGAQGSEATSLMLDVHELRRTHARDLVASEAVPTLRLPRKSAIEDA
jgi:hypothetical protein